MLDEKIFVDPYESTIVLKCIKNMYFENNIFGFWTPFSVTNHSAGKNIMLRPDLNQYFSGKQSFL
jgi:hypothetical protein